MESKEGEREEKRRGGRGVGRVSMREKTRNVMIGWERSVGEIEREVERE